MDTDGIIYLEEVTAENWREVIPLRVNAGQEQFVADPSFYLLLCHYGKMWHPMAIKRNDQIIGFLMWAIDPDDQSGWIGGFLIDSHWQGKGYGKQAILSVISYLKHTHDIVNYALSVQPMNPAVHLYKSIGFEQTDQWEDNEVVMRYQP